MGGDQLSRQPGSAGSNLRCLLEQLRSAPVKRVRRRWRQQPRRAEQGLRVRPPEKQLRGGFQADTLRAEADRRKQLLPLRRMSHPGRLVRVGQHQPGFAFLVSPTTHHVAACLGRTEQRAEE